jgi:voltage-gated potassium channel
MRKRLYRLLDDEGSSIPSRIFHVFLIILILSNVAAVVLESHKPISESYSAFFYWFEIFSVLIFTVEYLGRIWTCVEDQRNKDVSSLRSRLRYFFSPIGIIDLLAIAPFYLSMFFAVDLRYLRLLRMLRLLKLAHYFKGLDVFLTVLAREIATIASAVFTVLVLVMLSASLMYTLEREAQPDLFSSIPDALWWAIVTMTTVGYGDVTPVTTGGRLLATLIMLLGVGLVALPAGMLAARFGEELQSRKERMRAKVQHALQDGKVSEIERSELESLARELGYSTDALDRLIEIQDTYREGVTECPHCGHTLDQDARKSGDQTEL